MFDLRRVFEKHWPHLLQSERIDMKSCIYVFVCLSDLY